LKVTVAIPVYNAANYIRATLDSLMKQTMHSRDFEVICINDCSTDKSKEVIEAFKIRMENLVLIDRETNSGGPMIPRNDAIHAARGEYLLFLDNDDFLGEEALERLYNAAQENRSDVIYGKYIGVNGRNVPQSMFKKGNIANADIIRDNLVYSLAPHKMFNVSFLRKHQFLFDPQAVVGEDQLFVMQCYVEAKVITVLADYDYYFVVSRGNENLSLKYFPAKKFFYSFHQLIKYIDESKLNNLYKRDLKIAYLNRFFHASRLRRQLLSKKRTKEQKRAWLAETKKFIDLHISDEIMKGIQPRFHSIIYIAKKQDLKKLLKLAGRIKEAIR